MPGPYSFPTDRITGGPAPAADANAFGAAFNEADSDATPSVLVLRDAAGRARFADPDNAADAATKGWVETATGLLVPKSLVDAKGDLLAGTADNVLARLPVGTNGQILTADSAEATGMKWEDAPAGGGFTNVFFEANTGGGGTLSSSEFVTYPINTVLTNEGGASFSGTTYIYTIPAGGLYDCQATVRINDSSAARSFGMGIGIANADGPHFLWGQMGGIMRDAKQYRRITRFTTGDQVRLYIYSDGNTFGVNSGNLSIRKVAD